MFVSTDAGAIWTDISGDLPDTPVSALALDHNNPNTIYVGTDVGVFATNDLGTTWLAYDNGIPNSPIHFSTDSRQREWQYLSNSCQL